ncbi:MAG: zinc metallopeptidase [SAR324 cluster bacterium]|nr:zinc metallopeptidase [SAR324 cluster bacterium]
MHFLIPTLFFLFVFIAPGFWAKRILTQYNTPRNEFPGTGGELAVHFLDILQISDVQVEETELGDHYDPLEKKVRLTAGNYHGKSLTAVATAAHEVGHAIQDHTGYRPFQTRTALAQQIPKLEKLGSLILLAAPLLALVSRAPGVGLLTLFGGFCVLGLPVFVHLITLPVELDASFQKALPLLKAGEYIDPDDQKIARKILIACALTYVANSLAGMLNLARWLAVLKR